MNNSPAEPLGDPARLLTEARILRSRSRQRAHGGAWLPALVLAAVPILSIALYQHPMSSLPGTIVQYPYWAGLPHQQRSGLASYAFWLVLGPLTYVVVALWYRQRENRQGVRVRWKAAVVAGAVGLLVPLALVAAPDGYAAPVGYPGATEYLVLSGGVQHAWLGMLTPLISIGLAAIVLGVVERSAGITLGGAWFTLVAWQFCALGQIGGLVGWQSWVLGGGSGPTLGGQLTILGLDKPAPALLVMTLPLAFVAIYRAVRAWRSS